MRYAWGSCTVSNDRIRFFVATEAYGEWWESIRKFYGARRLARAPILGVRSDVYDG